MASVTYDHVWKKFGDVTALKTCASMSKTRNSLSWSVHLAAEKPPHYDAWPDLEEVTMVKF